MNGEMCTSYAIGIGSPQKHLDQPLEFCVGIRDPSACMRYFHAWKSRSRRQTSIVLAKRRLHLLPLEYGAGLVECWSRA